MYVFLPGPYADTIAFAALIAASSATVFPVARAYATAASRKVPFVRIELSGFAERELIPAAIRAIRSSICFSSAGSLRASSM
jgi:hypothetical protein